MKNVQEVLAERKLPALLLHSDGKPVTSEAWRLRRQELLAILQENIYGRTPEPCPVSARFLPRSSVSERYCAGKVVHDTVELTMHTCYGDHTFPLQLFRPRSNPNAPCFLHICFRPDYPDRYTPIEEITDHGFALAMFDYRDVSSDDGDFTTGLAGLYIGSRKRCPGEWGKIGMWAYAASRVLDFLKIVEGINASRVIVTGHSRLGKTALWCAAQDERFFCGISNDSGCGGAAIERGKVGERIDRITETLGYWFCPHYRDFAQDAYALPFDHHFVTACVAPRLCYIASAVEDTWADPDSEFLSAVAATPAWELLGKKGLSPIPAEMPVAPAQFHEGNVGYHVRLGSHYYGREDWIRQMSFLEAHL